MGAPGAPSIVTETRPSATRLGSLSVTVIPMDAVGEGCVVAVRVSAQPLWEISSPWPASTRAAVIAHWGAASGLSR